MKDDAKNLWTDQFLPNLSIDIVIVGYDKNELKCLLLRMGDKWLLPGGFIHLEDSVDVAAEKILENRAGLKNAHLKFLKVFGDHNRNFSNEWKKFFKAKEEQPDLGKLINNRFVTLAYYSFVDILKTSPKPGIFDEECKWFKFNKLPEMWMDHKEIVQYARTHFKQAVQDDIFTYNLLPEEFTMPELHQLHQKILDEKIDRSRFQKKMLASGKFTRLSKQIEANSPGRNPYKYKLK